MSEGPQVQPQPAVEPQRSQPEPQRDDRRRYRDDYYPPRSDSPNGLIGCALAMMFMVILALGGAVVWLALRTPNVGPAPVVVPTGNVTALVRPIKEKLSYEPVKAEKVYRIYSGLRDALAGPSGARVTDTRVFEAVTAAILTDIDASGGTPIGRDIDQAVATHLGISWGRDNPSDPEGWSYKQFDASDRTRLIEIVGAIAKAAGDTL